MMEPVHQPIRINKMSAEKESADKDEALTLKVINLESLRKIIILSSTKNEIKNNELKKWKPILTDLLNFLCTSNEIGNQTVFLASHAYLSLEQTLLTSSEFKSNVIKFLSVETSQTVNYDVNQKIHNLKLFRLLICNGFLQLHPITNDFHDIYEMIFQNIYLHCIQYTPYTYLAFKLLQKWMEQTTKINFWSDNAIELEEKLEAIIFSNWDNSISKTNIVIIFGIYMNIMNEKYSDFLIYLFYSCVERISWCHVTKYVILSEICKALDNINLLTESKFISNLFNSLSMNYLCSYSTKVYSNICKKLSKDLWISTFGEHLKNYVFTWESEKNYSTLQVFCKCWIEPIIKIHRDILPYLLECCDHDSVLYKSHLLRMAKKYGINIVISYDINNIFLNHEEEHVRLNMFAAYCYEVENLKKDQLNKLTSAIKHFLYFNATTDTTYLREGILNYFKILLSNILKHSLIYEDTQETISFLGWLHDFQLDCFEIGSCYQRKIFGLQLYKITLQFLQNNNCKNCIISKDPNFKEAIKFGPLLKEKMKESGKWNFTNKENIVILFKLILDSVVDIREISSDIIIDFFHEDIISDAEKMYLLKTAYSKCNSCKFFETESGANLFKILTVWFPFTDHKKNILESVFEFIERIPSNDFRAYLQLLFEESKRQLRLVKNDILKAVTQNTPFYGILTAYLIVGFYNGPDSNLITEKILEETLVIAESAANFFLNAFSSKSSDLEYSSSFEEMGLAINKAIKSSEVNYEFDNLVLSPAEQSIITCIWRSLKVLCEMCVEIAKNGLATDTIVRRASELIVMVSLKCRHKGVIESAGVSIGKISRYLCMKQKNTDLLKEYLKNLLFNDFSTNINLTRRGAGLPIMFHKIISNDVRSQRPLLNFAVQVLIEALQKSSIDKIEQRRKSNCDDPCAMYLYFLKTLVSDKELQPQLSPYLEEISLTCFEYMPSKDFTIRNASYQLFGALVIRLTGQNTGGLTVDFGYGYSINYFVSHFPRLAAYILSCLQAYCQSVDHESKLKNSMYIIHILSLLSKMFFSGCELIDGTSKNYVTQIRKCLHLLMDNPVVHVRNLVAKSYVATTGLKRIKQKMCHLKMLISSMNNFNQLHGYLSTLEYLSEKQNDETQSMSIKHIRLKSLRDVRKNLEIQSNIESLWNFWCQRAVSNKKKILCYSVEAQLLRLSQNFNLILVKNNSDCKKNNFLTLHDKFRPGFYEFVNELMKLFVRNIPYNEDNTLIHHILSAKCIDFGISFLNYAPQDDRVLLNIIADFLISNFEICHPLLLEKLIFFVNKSIRNMCKNKLIERSLTCISKLKVFVSKLNIVPIHTTQLSELSILVRILSLKGSESYDIFEENVSCVLNEKITLANYFNYSEISRLLLSKGLEILLYNFKNLNDDLQTRSLLAAFISMKDEVSSIRENIRNSVSNIILAHELSKEKIFDEIIYILILINLVSGKSIIKKHSYHRELLKIFEKYLTAKSQNFTMSAENPFVDQNITLYKEDSKLINFLILCLKKNTFDNFMNPNNFFENITDDIFNTRRDLIVKMNVDLNNLFSILNIEYDEYLGKKLKVMNEIYLNDYTKSNL